MVSRPRASSSATSAARFLGRIVDHQHAVRAGRLRRVREALRRPWLRSDWRSRTARPASSRRSSGTPRRTEHVLQRNAVLQRPLARALDHRTVGHRDRRTARRARSRRRRPSTSACMSGTASAGSGSPAVTKGISALRPCAARRASCERGCDAMRRILLQTSSHLLTDLMPDFSATVCMSLSPRPDRLTSRIWSLRHARRDLRRVRERVRRFERRNDAFEPAQVVKRLHALRRR